MGRRRKRHSLATTSAQYRMCWPIFLLGRLRFCFFPRRDDIRAGSSRTLDVIRAFYFARLSKTRRMLFVRVSTDSFPILDAFACLPDHQWVSVVDCFSSTCLLWFNRLIGISISTRQSIKGRRDRQFKHDLSDDNNNNGGKQSKTDSAQKNIHTRIETSLPHPISAIKDELGLSITTAARMHVSPLC